MKLYLIIPAHNEQERIERTVRAYASFFQAQSLQTTLLVVLNACTDATLEKVIALQKEFSSISYLDLKPGGKGFAIRMGFLESLKHDADLIGFVDADMATSPQEYYKLVTALDGHDGIIASRYMKGSIVTPPRPFIKRWGSKIFYETLVKLLFGIYYHDYQCGAKLFTRKVIETIAPQLIVDHWTFDVEILYLCKKYGFDSIEIPTIWHDQDHSKLRLFKSGFNMINSLFSLRWHYLKPAKARN